MVRSNVLPEAIWLRKTEMVSGQLFLILRVRSNITEVPVENMEGGMVTHYDYDEIEVRYPVPEGVTELADINNLITNEAGNISTKAIQTSKWQSINAIPANKLREEFAVIPVVINPTPVIITPKVLG